MGETNRTVTAPPHSGAQPPVHPGNAGWSQERLAAEAGVNRTYLSAVEREEQNISLDNIHKLAVALELEAMHLINARADFSVDGLAHLRSQPPTGGTRPNNLA
jgi:transcriptional regulator with XRE-family HTH domain